MARTVTPERYLHAARVKRRARNATAMVPCRVCQRLFMPHLGQLACSNTCCERVIHGRAKAAG
jgi:hypothetical protein